MNTESGAPSVLARLERRRRFGVRLALKLSPLRVKPLFPQEDLLKSEVFSLEIVAFT